MVPKPVYAKVRAYVQKLTKELESETVGKSGLAAIPIEVTGQVMSFITSQRGGQFSSSISDAEAKACCEYMVKTGLLAKHPWGGYMVPQSKDARDLVRKTLNQA